MFRSPAALGPEIRSAQQFFNLMDDPGAAIAAWPETRWHREPEPMRIPLWPTTRVRVCSGLDRESPSGAGPNDHGSTFCHVSSSCHVIKQGKTPGPVPAIRANTRNFRFLRSRGVTAWILR